MSNLKVDAISNLVESATVNVSDIAVVDSGTTLERPIPTKVGYSYFDTTLGHPIWWNGTVWKNSVGATV